MRRLLVVPVVILGLLVSCRPGLDLYTPPDARDYVAVCVRDRESVGCEAMLPTLGGVRGEITVLLINSGSEDIQAGFARYLAGKGLRIEEFLSSGEATNYARANIFRTSKLQTGPMRTLDGKTHMVECRAQGSSELCRIDGTIEGFNRLESEPGRVGSVYLMTGFLPF